MLEATVGQRSPQLLFKLKIEENYFDSVDHKCFRTKTYAANPSFIGNKLQKIVTEKGPKNKEMTAPIILGLPVIDIVCHKKLKLKCFTQGFCRKPSVNILIGF